MKFANLSVIEKYNNTISIAVTRYKSDRQCLIFMYHTFLYRFYIFLFYFKNLYLINNK